MKKISFRKVSVTMIIIAAIIAGIFYPAAKYSSVYADGVYVIDGRNDAAFLHKKTRLNENTDSAPVITFMHHGLSGSYGSLKELAKYLSLGNDVDIYYARVAGTPYKDPENKLDDNALYSFRHSTEKDTETNTIPKETAPVYKRYENGAVAACDPGNDRFRNLTTYDEVVRKIVDHDADGKVIYNEKIYDEIYDYEEDANGKPIDHYKKNSDGIYILDGDGKKILNEGTTYASRYGELEKFAVDLRKLGDNLKKEVEKGATIVPTIVDPSRHAIVLFEANDNKGSHAYIYNEFNAIVDRLSYDIFLATGAVPRVNLVSHSMGGVITMMYMTEHPYNVANYISIDSPHNFINLVSIAEAVLLPLINKMSLPGFDYKSFVIPQNDVYAIALLAEMFLPVLAAAGVVDPALAEDLQKPDMFLAFKRMVENIFSGNYGDSLDDMAEAAGLPAPTPEDVYTVLGIIGEAFGLPDLEGILTYDAEKCAFVVNFDAVISALLSNGEIAELLKTLSNGTINITPDNVTPEAIDAWLSQIGSGILKNISIIKHKNNKTREKIFRLADKGGLRKNS